MTEALSGEDHNPNGGNALETFIEALPMGVLLFDDDDRLLRCNATARRLFTGAIADDWFAARLDRHRNNDGPLDEQITDGRWLRIDVSPLDGGGGLMTCHDITAQKTHERKTLESLSRYQDLNEIGIALSSEKNVDRLLEMILNEAKKISHADGGTVYLYAHEETGSRKPEDRIDRRSGGDRRSNYDRRGPLVA